MTRLSFCTVVAGALLGLSGPASATIMTVTVNGIVSSFTDTSGAYGTVGANLAGKRVTNVYVIDTSLGTNSTGSSYLGNTYNENYADFPAGVNSASSTINGHTINFNLNLLDFQEQTTNPPGPYNFSLAEYQAEDFKINYLATGYNYTVSLIRDEPLSYSLAIPLSIDTPYSVQIDNVNGPIYGSGVFATYYVGYDYATQALIQTSNVGYFDLLSVNVTSSAQSSGPAASVPEPSGLAIMFVGLFGFGAWNSGAG